MELEEMCPQLLSDLNFLREVYTVFKQTVSIYVQVCDSAAYNVPFVPTGTLRLS
jgi:hypothetical protein